MGAQGATGTERRHGGCLRQRARAEVVLPPGPAAILVQNLSVFHPISQPFPHIFPAFSTQFP